MKKRGFTLVELMGVIVILGVIVLIATQVIRKLTSESKDELYAIQISNLKDGLKNWAIDNSKTLPKNEGDVVTVTLGQLKMGGYVDVEIRNPKSNKCFGNDMTLEIERYKKNYIYTVNDTTGTETTTCDDYKKPYIILNGKAITYVEVNEEYIEEGIIAKDAIGNDITSQVTRVVTGSGNTVDTTKVGNKYTITYTVTVAGETTSVNRNVIVRDTIAPTLIIPDSVVLGKNHFVLDVMVGVSANDNSNEPVDIQAKSNITFGIPGEYTITYTATDSSGNSINKIRKVTILKDNVNGIMTSKDNCINSGVCPNGTLVSVRVNEMQTHNFYVIKDTGSKLTLLLDHNLGNQVAWIKVDDFIAAGGNPDDWSRNDDCVRNIFGPLTALTALQQRTSSWTNLPLITISTFDYDDGTEQPLGNNIKFQTYARLPKYSEISILLDNNNLLPEYVYINLKGSGGLYDGYWLSTASTSDNYSCGVHGGAWNVDDERTILEDGVFLDINDSIRPVIELSK